MTDINEAASASATASDEELLAYVENARDSFRQFIELRRISGAVRPPRFDLALAACQVAAASGELDVAQAFAQTAIDFMTGTYEPFEDEPTQ